MRIQRCGPNLFYVDLSLPTQEGRGQRMRAVVDHLRAVWPDARITAGAGTLMVEGALTESRLQPRLQEALSAPVAAQASRHHRISIRYDGEDLGWVAEQTGLTVQQVVGRHAGRHYQVELLGFMPGFAYLTGLDEKLVLPRRASPRTRVDALSVGMAGAMTGVYPAATSGGWHLLGHAVDINLFDPIRTPPCLLAPGDRVEFIPTSETDAPALTPSPPLHHGHPVLTVESVLGCVTVQDHGRPHLLSQGIPASGPMDPYALDAANHAVGNSRNAAALEVLHGALTLRARERCVLSVNGAAARTLQPGDTIRLTGDDGALHYVAIQGGLDAPKVLGSRSALLSAHVGRLLRKGDLLAVGSEREGGWEATRAHHSGPLRVWPGPHAHRFPDGAWASLMAQTWRLSTSLDRVGIRLSGQPVARLGQDTSLPEPMMRGAIQVTPDGTPIVLGPDAPATGGYPILGVVEPISLAQLAHLRPGETVRFAAV